MAIHHPDPVRVLNKSKKGSVLLIHKFHGFVVSWFRGFMVSWFRGFVVSWFRGFMVSWFHGFVVSWFGDLKGLGVFTTGVARCHLAPLPGRLPACLPGMTYSTPDKHTPRQVVAPRAHTHSHHSPVLHPPGSLILFSVLTLLTGHRTAAHCTAPCG